MRRLFLLVFLFVVPLSSSYASPSIKFRAISESDIYKVESLHIERIAGKNTPPVLCQRFHIFPKPYWAPREWSIDLNSTPIDDVGLEATVHWGKIDNGVCEAELITAIRVVLRNTEKNTKVEYMNYLYNDGSQSSIINASCVYETREDYNSIMQEGLNYSEYCQSDSEESFTQENENTILVIFN